MENRNEKPLKPKIDVNLLLRSVNEKDAKGWNALFDYFYPQLCSYAGRMLNSAEEAEDCVQGVFLYLWNEKMHFDSLEGLTYFAYRATHNQALMRIRHEKRRAVHLQHIGKESSGEADDLFAKIVREDLLRQVYEHVKALPAEQEKVIRMCLSGLGNQEIADKLGISVNTVKTHKARGLKFLRERAEEGEISVLCLCLFKRKGFGLQGRMGEGWNDVNKI